MNELCEDGGGGLCYITETVSSTVNVDALSSANVFGIVFVVTAYTMFSLSVAIVPPVKSNVHGAAVCHSLLAYTLTKPFTEIILPPNVVCNLL